MVGFVASLLLTASLTGHLTAHAVPVVVLQSLVVLSSSNAPPCIAAALPSGLLLSTTSSNCPLDSLSAARGVADVSFLEADAANIQLTLRPPVDAEPAVVTVAWSDHAMRVLRYRSVNVSASSLALPAQVTALPTALDQDAEATILDVDATTPRVSSVDQVVFVDNALCGTPPRPPTASVCVLPLNVHDRRSVTASDVPSPPHSFRFLVKRDAATGSHVLLGLGLPLLNRGVAAAHDDGFRRFKWLGASLRDPEFARVVGQRVVESAGSDTDRLFEHVVSGIDTTTEIIAEIRDDHNHTRCTGVLIAPRAVRTSRQCENFTHSYVRLGMRDPEGKTPQEVLPVFSYMRHKKYNNVTGAYDGLVLRLTKPSAHSAAVLQTNASASFEGRNTRIYGFGTASILYVPAVRSIDVAVGPPNSECGARLGRSLLASKFCTSAGTFKDGCYKPGDIGAPLFVDSANARPQLVGILFDDKVCRAPNRTSVFTRVASIMTLVRVGIKRSNQPIGARAAEDDDALFEETLVA